MLDFAACRKRLGGRGGRNRAILALVVPAKLVCDPVVRDEQKGVGGDVGQVIYLQVVLERVKTGVGHVRTRTELRNALTTPSGRLLINLWSSGACFEGIGTRFFDGLWRAGRMTGAGWW